MAPAHDCKRFCAYPAPLSCSAYNVTLVVCGDVASWPLGSVCNTHALAGGRGVPEPIMGTEGLCIQCLILWT